MRNHESHAGFSWGTVIATVIVVAFIIAMGAVWSGFQNNDRYYFVFDNGKVARTYHASTAPLVRGTHMVAIRKCEVGPQMDYQWKELKEEIYSSDSSPNMIHDPEHNAPFLFIVVYNREHVPFLKTLSVPQPGNPKFGLVIDPQALEAELMPGVYRIEQTGGKQMLVRISTSDFYKTNPTGYKYEYALP